MPVGSLSGFGVSKYQDTGIAPLHYADQDATDFAQALLAQKGKMYSDVVLRVLTNDKATKAEIEKQLDWLADAPTVQDVSLLFISGHGVNLQRPGGGKETAAYYFLPFDVQYANDHVFDTGISYSRIIEYISTVNGRKLVFLDTGHSGVMGEHDATGMLNALTRDAHGVVVYSATTGNQDALELAELHHGAFTYAILEAITGKGDAPKFFHGPITPRSLGFWLDTRVSKLTGGRQTPSIVDLSGASFVVFATPS